MPGTKAAVTRKVPSRLIDSTLRQSAKVMSSKFFCGKMPAQLITMSTWLNFLPTSLAMAATELLGRHVAFDGDGLTAGGLDHFHGRRAVADVDDGDVHAVLGQPLGEGLPDAAGGAGDDGDFVLVTFGHCDFSRCTNSNRLILSEGAKRPSRRMGRPHGSRRVAIATLAQP